jgi:hypothetical protein
VNQWLNPLHVITGSNLVDMGRAAVRVGSVNRADNSDIGGHGRSGGHGEGLRRSRGEAAGEKLGADPIERCMVNMGTIRDRPPHRPARSVTGRPAVG